MLVPMAKRIKITVFWLVEDGTCSLHLQGRSSLCLEHNTSRVYWNFSLWNTPSCWFSIPVAPNAW